MRNVKEAMAVADEKQTNVQNNQNLKNYKWQRKNSEIGFAV